MSYARTYPVRRFGVMLIVAAVGLVPSSLLAREVSFADSTIAIHLKDGRTIYGRIIKETDDVIRIEDKEGVHEMPRSFVKSIERKALPPSEPISAPKTDAVARVAQAPDTTMGIAGTNRFPTAKGSLLFDVQLVYSSITANDDKGDALTNISFGLGASTFIVQGVGIGLNVAYTSIGGFGIGTSSSTVSALAIGPKVTLVLGTEKSSVFPYLHFAYNHLTLTTESRRGITIGDEGANSFAVGVGFLFKRYGHIGIPLEFGATFQTFDKVTVAVYGIGVGVSGFLYDLF